MFDFIEDKEAREKAESVLKTQMDEVKGSINDQITAAVEESTKGLKLNHDKLLDEKKKLQEKYANITDPEEALEALKLVNENEDMRLIKDGKFDEVIEKRLSEKTQEYETQIGEVSNKYKEAATKAERYQTLYETKLIEDSLREAAVGAKVLPHAINDILVHGHSIFSIAEDGSVEARDKNGKLMKTEDDKILTPTLWIEGRKKTSPHYWPPSEGGDLNPGEDYESIDAQMKRAAANGNTALYRKLKEKKKKATR